MIKWQIDTVKDDAEIASMRRWNYPKKVMKGNRF